MDNFSGQDSSVFERVKVEGVIPRANWGLEGDRDGEEEVCRGGYFGCLKFKMVDY